MVRVATHSPPGAVKPDLFAPPVPADDWDDVDAPEQIPRKRDRFEDLFASQCRASRLPAFEREVMFAKRVGRKWRFDFAFRPFRVAVEIEGLAVKRLGGVLVVMGRHATITGIAEDMAKYNTAALLGWTVLRFRQADVRPKRALEITMRVLAARGWRQP